MTTIDDGGPAFPSEKETTVFQHGGYDKIVVRNEGMSLRDWFAGQAMVAMLSRSDLHFAYESSSLWPSWNGMFDNNRNRHVPAQSTLAKMAYEAADAMLAARKVTP